MDLTKRKLAEPIPHEFYQEDDLRNWLGVNDMLVINIHEVYKLLTSYRIGKEDILDFLSSSVDDILGKESVRYDAFVDDLKVMGLSYEEACLVVNETTTLLTHLLQPILNQLDYDNVKRFYTWVSIEPFCQIHIKRNPLFKE